MVNITQCFPRIRVEQKRCSQRFRLGFSHLLEALKRQLQPPTLRVWKISRRRQEDYWQAFNPKTGQTFSGSEAGIRQWIEQQYRH